MSNDLIISSISTNPNRLNHLNHLNNIPKFVFEKVLGHLSLRDWVTMREVCKEWKQTLSKINYLCSMLDADYLIQNQKLNKSHLIQWFDVLNINTPTVIKISKTGSSSDLQMNIDCGICDTIRFNIVESKSLLRKKHYFIKPTQWDSQMVQAVKITISQWEQFGGVAKTFVRSVDIFEQKFKFQQDPPWKFTLQLFPEPLVGPAYMVSKEIATRHQLNVISNGGIRMKRFQVLFDDDLAHFTTIKILQELSNTQQFVIILKMGAIYLSRKKYKAIYKIIRKSTIIDSKTDLNGYLGRISGEWLITSICTPDQVLTASKLWNMPTLPIMISNLHLIPQNDYVVTDLR